MCPENGGQTLHAFLFLTSTHHSPIPASIEQQATVFIGKLAATACTTMSWRGGWTISKVVLRRWLLLWACCRREKNGRDARTLSPNLDTLGVVMLYMIPLSKSKTIAFQKPKKQVHGLSFPNPLIFRRSTHTPSRSSVGASQLHNKVSRHYWKQTKWQASCTRRSPCTATSG